jgi:hypothetical protein
LLVFELGEGNTSDLDIANFLESFKRFEYVSERILVGVRGKILEEESLVRANIFVGNQGGSSLDRAGLLGGGGVGLRFGIFLGTLEVYYVLVQYLPGDDGFAHP